MDDEFRSLILLGDVDELLREVDRRVGQRDWEGLHRLRAACDAASDTGHQLWPVSSWISYMLVLRGDHSDVAIVLNSPPPVFTHGPLTEVAAQRSTWAEIGHLLDGGPVRAGFAAERAIRGEDLRHELPVDGHLVEVPLRLEPWEPAYRRPTYSEAGCDAGVPDAVKMGDTVVSGSPHTGESDSMDDVQHRGAAALEAAVGHYRSDEISVVSIALRGDAAMAVAAVPAAGGEELLIGPTSWADALSELAWWASGGPRRSGCAAGRTRTWWALTGLADALDDWPIADLDARTFLGDTEPFRFSRVDGTTLFGLAVEDPHYGDAWALELRKRPDRI